MRKDMYNQKTCVNFYEVDVEKIKYMKVEFDSSIKKGAVGEAEGEKIQEAFRIATLKRLPLVAWVSSGGMKITEGVSSLMQMVKITAAVKSHKEQGLMFIAVICDICFGGISVCLVSQADYIIAERRASYGFAGKRIIYDTFRSKLPRDFQSAMYAYKHGLIDIIIEKNEIENQIIRLLKIYTAEIEEKKCSEKVRGEKNSNTLAFINCICDDFIEIKGDRIMGDDPAMFCAICCLSKRPVIVIDRKSVV